jgi:hypothetical protein
MRLLGLRTFAVFVGLWVSFPFSAAALVAVGALEIPGVTESVVVVDGVAYVAGSDFLTPGGPGLRIIDVSDPTAPVEVGAVNTPGGASLVAVVDGLAYVAHRSGGGEPSGIRMIDISDPAAPVEVGAIEPLNTVSDFAVDGGVAVVVDEIRQCSRDGCTFFVSLRVFDVSNPAVPVEFDALCAFLCGTRRVDMVGSLLYVARSASGGGGPGDVQIIDISNPAVPVQVGLIEPQGAASDVTVVDGLAYVEDIVSLRIVDVSNPAAPIDLGSLDVPFVQNVAVESGFAYLTYLRSGLRVADISNLAAPVGFDGMLDPTSGARDVAIAGGLAYVVGVSGLAVVDLSNPAFPVELGAIESETQAIAVDEGLAYTVGRGLRVIGISNLAEFGSLPGNNWVDVAVEGGLAYVAARRFPANPEAGLRLFGVWDPSSPVDLGFIAFRRPAAVAVEDGSAYIVSSSGLLIVDSMVELGGVGGSGIDVVGGLAYVAADSGLLVIDVSNPAAPVEIGASPGGAQDVVVEGGLAYVAGGDSLRVIDVSIPAAPVELGAISIVGGANHVAVEGGLAYVAGGDSLRVIDVSNPAAPVELGGVDVSSTDVAVVDGLAYVVGGNHLRVVDFGPEYTGSIEIDVDIKPGSDPNSINPSLAGDLPVAILGSDSFDVAIVDVTTLAFGPSGASFDHSHGPHFEDLNGDGLTDLTAHFRTEETGIAFGDRMACLSGEVLDGTPFGGCDDVRTVPDMDGDKLPDVAEATIGTHALNPDTDRDGFEDGEEVLEMGTDPLDAMDPAPAQNRGPRKGGRRRR